VINLLYIIMISLFKTNTNKYDEASYQDNIVTSLQGAQNEIILS